MDPILYEWGGLLIRWLHMITGICWIGSSFYFMHIDASIKSDPRHPQGQGRRKLGGARRRLLPGSQIPRGARQAPARADLAQVGSLHDLDLRLLPAGLGLLFFGRPLSDRSICARDLAVGRIGDRHWQPRARLGGLRPPVQVAIGQARDGARRRRLRLHRRHGLGVPADLLRAAAPSSISAR